MRLLLLFLAVLPACYGYIREDFFQNHVKNFLNHSISPCDDFYDHVCSVNRSETRVQAYMKECMENFLAPYVNPIYKKILNIIEESEKKNVTIFESEEKMLAEVMATCAKNVSRCEQLLHILYPDEGNDTKPDELSFDEMTYRIAFKLYKIVEIAESFGESAMYHLHWFAHMEAAYTASEKNENFRNDYVAAVKMAAAMLDKLKVVMVRNFEDTQWMKNNHRVKYYQELVRNMYQFMFFDPKIQKGLPGLFEAMLTEFNKCPDIIFGWHPIEMKFCLLMQIMPKIRPLGADEHQKDVLHLDAGYDPEDNGIRVRMQALFMFVKDRISQLATFGFILAHEISHGLYGYKDDIDQLEVQNLDCIMEHRRQICSISNFICHMGNTTIEEDAPDITGLAAILDLFGEEAKNGLLNGNPPGISEEQFFFYLDHTITEPGVLDNHSPAKGRMNALLMHSEKFQEAFKCQKGDRMWREPDNFCHLLGPDANRR